MKRTYNQSKGPVLTMQDIPLIRGLLAHDIPVREIAEKFECSKKTIYAIKNGINWSHITEVAK